MWRFGSYLFPFLAASAMLAATHRAEYFPLQVGNQWVYRQVGAIEGPPIVVEVLQADLVTGKRYFLVSGLTSEAVWLRVSEEGVLSSLDRESGREAVWAVFSTAEGETYNTEIHPCNRIARVDSASARVRVPSGEFENALAVSYPTPSCADAGLESDFFVPKVGLVQRTMTSIAGPVTLSLIYARVEGGTVISQPEVSFSLALDRAVYTTRLFTPVMTARITLRVTQPEPLELTFLSGQRFDIELKSEDGRVVFRWSDGRIFPLAFGVERFGPGERNWVVEIPLLDSNGNLFDPGKYTAECWLTTAREREYSARVGFEISSARSPGGGSNLNGGGSGLTKALAVAWNDRVGSATLGALRPRPPWQFQGPLLPVGVDSTLRYAHGRLYLVSRSAGTVSVVDPHDWTSRQIAFLGANSEPEDLAVVSPQTAYVTRRTHTHLLRLNLATGATQDVVDLSPFADSDGIPDMGTMALYGGRLFVQIRRVNQDAPGLLAPPFYIAVVDLRTESLVDVEPQRAGVQAIELRGTSPKHKMQVIPQKQQLFVSATGTTHDAGGIEAIDLRTLRTLGLVVREADGLAGADAGPFVMVTPERGYLVFTTDADLSSHLAPFTLKDGIKPEGDLYISLGYAAPGVEFDERTGALFFPDGGLDVDRQGIYVFDAATDERLGYVPLPAGSWPSDLLLIPSSVPPPRARGRGPRARPASISKQ